MDSSGRGRARTMTAVLWKGSWEERGSVSTASARRQNKSLLIPYSMEQAGDFSMTIPLIFTALAVILATLIVKLRAAKEKQPAEAAQEEKKETVLEEPSETEEKDKEDPIAEQEVSERTETDRTIPVEEVGQVVEVDQVEEVDTVEESPQVKEHETEVEECTAKESTPSSHSSQEEEDSKEEDFETEGEKILKISEADDADDETFSFKYFPGKLRGSDYEKMLTKEELEEEQRVEDDKKLLQSS
ncbi:matrix-remodeling-associated protein 7 isoform 2-T2 [Leptodactylus fuscus]|uniref:matrix-remodeling-associated protein 7 isoform X2 n=1 Tax=Leptodactylus fuscus TaxID=238119 RepID=UPI003F4F06DF